MNAAQDEQDHGRPVSGEEHSEDVGSWDGDFEEAEPSAGLRPDQYLDDPRHGQARVLNRRIE